MRRATVIWTVIIPLLIAVGCQSFHTDGRDPLSAGSAKLLLEKSTTTPDEVMRTFGGPNVVYGNAEGRETWTYDRMSYVTAIRRASARHRPAP